MAINEKCAAGLGRFLKYMAARLDLTLEDMSALSLSEASNVQVNDGCIVFAELDALGLLNRGISPRDVAAAVTDAAAVRANTVINEITAPIGDRVVLIGGLTKNKAFVEALKRYSKIDFIIPEEAEYAEALGAAILAAHEA
jgi:activator of 2-hydroxyglutaryl-CoA dehydratase